MPLVAGLLLCSYSSYSEEVFGVTQNAAAFKYDWVMRNILPQQAGLQVNGVFYRYSVFKETEDDFIVSVQNENARGSGYIFREVDDWSGLPSNTISKNIPVPNIDISYWGAGSIATEGNGTVDNAEVLYSYKYDPCFDPQSDPNCPGYKDPFVMQLNEVQIVDPLDEDYIQAELDRKAQLKQQEEDERQRQRRKFAEAVEEEEEERLEDLLGISDQNDFSKEQIRLHNELMDVRGIPNSYLWSLSGGDYPESVTLKDSKLPRNKRGLNVALAQEVKHQQLVNLQYAKRK